MREVFRAADHLRRLYPGFNQMSVSPLDTSDTGTLMSFNWPAECPLTAVLRYRMLARGRAWPAFPQADPNKPEFPRPGWGPYVYQDAPAVPPDDPFPRGIGVCWDTTNGGKLFLVVLMRPFLTRLIEPSLDISVEQVPLWAANFPPLREEPGGLGNRPLTFLIDAISQYVAPHGIKTVTIATKGGQGHSATRLLRRQTKVVQSGIFYGHHALDLVDIPL